MLNKYMYWGVLQTPAAIVP